MTSPGRATSIERLLNGFLGPDASRAANERFRWYEAVAGVSALQWIVVPWTLAVLMWTSADVMAPQLALLYAVFVIPTFLGNVYVTQKRLDLAIGRFTVGRVLLGLVVSLPFPVFVAGYLVANGWDRGVIIQTGFGLLIGSVAAGGVLLYVLRNRRPGDGSEHQPGGHEVGDRR